MDATRRALLRNGAGALATGLVGTFAGCSGDGEDGTDSDDPPRVAFDHRYEPVGPKRGRVELVHDGGEALTAGALFVVGSGFTAVDSADQTGRGPWRGETVDGEVVEGNAVVVGAARDCELTLSYQATGENVTLATARGPNA